MARTTNDLNKDIESMLENKKLRFFVRWYCDGAKPEEWDKIKSYIPISMEEALVKYLERDDIKQAIAYVTKSQKDINLIKVTSKLPTITPTITHNVMSNLVSSIIFFLSKMS